MNITSLVMTSVNNAMASRMTQAANNSNLNESWKELKLEANPRAGSIPMPEDIGPCYEVGGSSNQTSGLRLR